MTAIGIIGAGVLGGTLARQIARAGKSVTVANSRAPQTLSDIVGEGVVAGWAKDVAANSEVLFVVLPYSAIPDTADLLAEFVPSGAIVVDVGNYYPGRDGSLRGLDGEDPPADSLWVSDQIGRPIYKAFNSITYAGLLNGGLPKGAPTRIGLPVAGPGGAAKGRLNQLVDELGFDPVDGGTLAQSWRQQPGSPIYCTDLSAAEVQKHLAGAKDQDARTYRENRSKYDEATAVGYERIRLLRAQGRTLDEILDAMAAETESTMSEVHQAQQR